MTRIRRIEIDHFRSISHLDWYPEPGINCLIGPGDSGKSTILDAIDLCLGARRQAQFTDSDFHGGDFSTPICISMTIGDLDESMMNMEAYGPFLRGFIDLLPLVEDEPAAHAETVLTIRLMVESDLEPSWTLFSERAEAQNILRGLAWNDRVRIAPTRIGAVSDYHLGWRRGSVLNRLSDESANAAGALAEAARGARQAFGEVTQSGMRETLDTVTATARELGIPVGEGAKAMLDSQMASFKDGAVTLHDGRSIPLRSLGMGSARLLIAGLQRKTANGSSLILMDELEYGLEPHRIIRLLGSIGAKLDPPPLQAFASTHSPVVLRELSGSQLFIVRAATGGHVVKRVGVDDLMQGTIRSYPEAFLARSVIICEGASEVGLMRGLDRYRVSTGLESIFAQGVALVDCNGGEPDKPFKRAAAFRKLGYRVAVIRDDDQQPTARVEADFIANSGYVTRWNDGRALEDELFHCLDDAMMRELLERSVRLNEERLVDDHIKSASRNTLNLQGARSSNIDENIRSILGKAAQSKHAPWFKSVTRMEEVANDIVGPGLATCEQGFRSKMNAIFEWANGDAG